MLARGYIGYLASIAGTRMKKKLEPMDVHVVSTFMDVFLMIYQVTTRSRN